MKKLLSIWLLLLLAAPVQAAAPQNQLPEQMMLDLDEVPLSFSQLKGKIIILNFWATWCPPCRREMPTFIELQEQYGDQGVQFIGIAVDNPKMAKRYGSDHGINFPLLQGEANGLELSIQLGNKRMVLPYTVIFDRNGKVIARRTGEIHKEEILSKITPIL